MAIIYSYPTVIPTANDLVLGTDVDQAGKPTKNFTVKSIIDLVSVTAQNLSQVLTTGNDALGQSMLNVGNITATGITSTFTGNLTGNVTGNLNGIHTSGSINGVVTGFTQPLGTSNTTLATTKFVMDKVDPSILTFLGTNGNNQTVNLATQIFTVLGTANQIETDGTAQKLTIKFPTAGVTLPNGSLATTQLTSDDSDKVATTKFVHDFSDAQDLDFSDGANSGSVILGGPNAQVFEVQGTSGQVLTAASSQTLTISLPNPVVRNLTGNVTGILKDGSSIETTVTGVTQTQGDDSTKLATTKYVDAAAAGKTLDYAGTITGPFSLNLETDDLEFNGDSNITVAAADVTVGNKGIVTIDLNDSVTISGTMNANKFETTAGTATWATTILTGFTSITSIAPTAVSPNPQLPGFIGNPSASLVPTTDPVTTVNNVQFQGNASTANSLKLTGTVSMSGDTVATGVTYTNGGSVPLVSTISDSVVYNKTLAGFNAGTGSVANGDSIIEALEKLQGQITTLPQGLVYQGVWSAVPTATGGGTPDLTDTTYQVNGHFYICDTAGTAAPNGTGTTPNDWDVRDWVIFADDGAGGGVDEWQKIDNSSLAGGSGTANTITKWTNNQVIGNSTITDDGSTVTIADTVNFITKGNNTFGNTSADVSSFLGNVTLSENLILQKGLSVSSSSTVPYGAAGDVLTSGGGVDVANTWTTPTVGTLTGITAGAGITTQLNADANNVTVNVDYLGTDNVILEATQITAGAAIPSSAEIMFNDNTTAGTNTVSYAPISSLPFIPTVSGTQYTIPMFATNTTLGDSVISQDLTGIATVTIGSALKMGFHIFMDDNAIKEISELSFGANAYITSPSNFLVRFNQTSVDIPSGNLTVGTIANATTDTDKFLVSDSGVIKYRTGAEVLSDIGAAPVTGGAYLPLAGGTLTGALTGTDATFSGTVSLADDKSLILGNTPDSKIFFDNAASVLADSTVIQSTPTSGTGTILLQSYNVKMRDQLGTSNMFHATRYGVTLYYDGDVKFTTTSSGVNLNGFGSGTKTGTAAYNLSVNSAGDVIETNANPGGSGGGIFSGSKAITTTSPAQKAFTLTRAATGTLIFDVWFTSETNLNSSVAKKYTVAHAYNATPVYNKIIDTGKFPNPFPFGTDTGFTVSFVNATALSVECYIIATGSIYSTQDIGYTIQVGHDGTNALTFTPA